MGLELGAVPFVIPYSANQLVHSIMFKAINFSKSVNLGFFQSNADINAYQVIAMLCLSK